MKTGLHVAVILLFKRLNFIFTQLFGMKSLSLLSQLSSSLISSWAHSAWILMQHHLHCHTAIAIWYYWSSAESIVLSCVIVSIIPSWWVWPPFYLFSLVSTEKEKTSLASDYSCWVNKWAIHLNLFPEQTWHCLCCSLSLLCFLVNDTALLTSSPHRQRQKKIEEKMHDL